MIKINEIRLGNIVLNRFNEIEVLNIIDSMQWLEDDYNGLLLTDDLLTKLKFTKKELVTITFYEDYNIALNLGNKRSDYAYYLKGWKGYSKEIRYLHELQNLYFALTGKELDVNILVRL